MILTKSDQDRIANAIRSAEANTSGQIVCVLAKISSQATSLPIVIASILSLATPWVLTGLTAMTVYKILSLQVIVFLLLLNLFCIPSIRISIIPRKAKRALAHRAAMQQFLTRGIGRKTETAGVLIFVSIAERYARIVASDAIAQRVPQAEWQAAVDALTAHLSDGRISDGFISAINACGEKLLAHFPRTELSTNALRDCVYLI
jgi:putative membrane protein